MEGPIKIRLDMLTTGIRAPVGVKIAGPDLQVLQALAQRVAGVIESLPGTISALTISELSSVPSSFTVTGPIAAAPTSRPCTT